VLLQRLVGVVDAELLEAVRVEHLSKPRSRGVVSRMHVREPLERAVGESRWREPLVESRSREPLERAVRESRPRAGDVEDARCTMQGSE
jgi:hypothetical protein